MQKVRCHPHFQKTPTACKLLISGSISLPFSGFFSPFPRGTCSLSVRTTYLEIRGWYPDVRWIITSPTYFWIIHPFFSSILQDWHLLWPLFHQISNRFLRNISLFFRFRSPLLTKSLLISFPQATKMFQFAWFFTWGFPLLDTCISPFPPYSFRFSRPFVFDLGIHEKPFHFFYMLWVIMCLCVFVCVCVCYIWYIAYLIPIFTVFSCIRCFIFRFEMLLKSFFAAQMSHEPNWFIYLFYH